MSHHAIPPRALLLLAVLTLVWGTNWTLFPLAVQEVSVWTFRAVALPVAGLTLLSIARLRGLSLHIDRQDRPTVLAASLAYLVVWNIASTYSAVMIPSGQAAVLGFTMPLWAALLGWAVGGERMRARMLLALALMLALMLAPTALMLALDTNVLVRYLAQDDAKQAAAATRLIERTLSASDRDSARAAESDLDSSESDQLESSSLSLSLSRARAWSLARRACQSR